MNEYFQTGAVPAPSSPGASSVMRQEFANIAAGFDKLPVLAGHAGEIVVIDPTGSRMETNGTLLSSFATLTGVQELTNKTISWAGNTFTGFGDAATKVAGTGAGEVLLLAEANKLPALDGSLLTNLNQGSLSTVSIAKGGTGATDLAGAQANLGIDLKADANNAVLTGAPTTSTPSVGDASARIATTSFVADTMQAIGAFGPSSANPLMNGTVSPGVAILGSRSDHVHPIDTSRASVASPTFTGVPAAPTAAADTNTTQLATTAFMIGQAGSSSPLMDGVAAVGTSVKFARQDHVHPTDTSRAPINSPTFTGAPAAPTPLTSDNTTKVATTAFVQSLLAQQPPAGMQPSNSTPLMDGTAAAGTGVEGSRYDHVHPSDTSRVNKAGDTMTGNLNVPSLNDGPLAGFRNRLINGCLRVWQRGNTQSTNGYNSADRWYFEVTGGTFNVTKQQDPCGFIGSDEGTYLQLTATSAVGGFITQAVENVRKLSGKTVVLSYYYYTNSGADNTGTPPYIRQHFGSGGSPSGPVDNYPVSDVSIDLGGGNFRRVMVFNLQSTSTRTIGTANDDSLKVIIPFAGTFSKSLWGFQLEAGSVATPFELRPLSVEQSLCYRYFYAMWGTCYLNGLATSNNNAHIQIPLPVPLRGPTSVFINGAVSEYTVNRADGSDWSQTNNVVSMVTSATQVMLSVNTSGIPGLLIANQPVSYRWGAGVYLAVGSELF